MDTVCKELIKTPQVLYPADTHTHTHTERDRERCAPPRVYLCAHVTSSLYETFKKKLKLEMVMIMQTKVLFVN